MSALSAIEAGEVDEISMPGSDPAATGVPELRRHGLYVVTGPSGPGQPFAGAGRPQDKATAPRPQRARRRAAPVRLTRRGRVVVAALAVVLATIVAMVAAGGAQAANHGRAGGGYQGMHEIVVQPGQTLWSIAARAEPAADPRLVIAQIMTANSMTSSVVDAGELLWVPS